MAGAFLNRLIWACQFRGITPATIFSHLVARLTGGSRRMTANSHDARKACAQPVGIFFVRFFGLFFHGFYVAISSHSTPLNKFEEHV
jgi:hypothetical protein